MLTVGMGTDFTGNTAFYLCNIKYKKSFKVKAQSTEINNICLTYCVTGNIAIEMKQTVIFYSIRYNEAKSGPSVSQTISTGSKTLKLCGALQNIQKLSRSKTLYKTTIKNASRARVCGYNCTTKDDQD